jgi:hypothetical protein
MLTMCAETLTISSRSGDRAFFFVRSTSSPLLRLLTAFPGDSPSLSRRRAFEGRFGDVERTSVIPSNSSRMPMTGALSLPFPFLSTLVVMLCTGNSTLVVVTAVEFGLVRKKSRKSGKRGIGSSILSEEMSGHKSSSSSSTMIGFGLHS